MRGEVLVTLPRPPVAADDAVAHRTRRALLLRGGGGSSDTTKHVLRSSRVYTVPMAAPSARAAAAPADVDDTLPDVDTPELPAQQCAHKVHVSADTAQAWVYSGGKRRRLPFNADEAHATPASIIAAAAATAAAAAAAGTATSTSTVATECIQPGKTTGPTHRELRAATRNKKSGFRSNKRRAL
ncbi:hypothetical protein JKP88DRAFT_280185 [Tribonema minus]|uniref:Uncharacterized protein n=1 Tax=Tribonema minus TaxID=303371 RepID=A0A835YSY1_9STRA|nr:hypothetical protein JKP88DRAFT_280185 [Tribonema minus]